MNVTHFDPYFYVPCPRGFTNDDLEPFKNHLNVWIYNQPLMPTLKCLCRKFQGVTMLHEQNLSKNKVSGVIREIRPSISSGSLQLTQEIYLKFEISTLQAR